MTCHRYPIRNDLGHCPFFQCLCYEAPLSWVLVSSAWAGMQQAIPEMML